MFPQGNAFSHIQEFSTGVSVVYVSLFLTPVENSVGAEAKFLDIFLESPRNIFFFENQDQRRAAAHSGTKAAEAEPVAEPVHRAASWLNWFVKTFLKEFVDGSLMLNWALNLGLNKK